MINHTRRGRSRRHRLDGPGRMPSQDEWARGRVGLWVGLHLVHGRADPGVRSQQLQQTQTATFTCLAHTPMGSACDGAGAGAGVGARATFRSARRWFETPIALTCTEHHRGSADEHPTSTANQARHPARGPTRSLWSARPRGNVVKSSLTVKGGQRSTKGGEKAVKGQRKTVKRRSKVNERR